MHSYLETIPVLYKSAIFVPFALSQQEILMPELEAFKRSDHDAFWEAGYNAMFITDTADLRNPGYHCEKQNDDTQYLDYGFAVDVLSATQESIEEALNR